LIKTKNGIETPGDVGRAQQTFFSPDRCNVISPCPPAAFNGAEKENGRRTGAP